MCGGLLLVVRDQAAQLALRFNGVKRNIWHG